MLRFFITIFLGWMLISPARSQCTLTSSASKTCRGNTLSFTINGATTFSSILWDFGDGEFSTMKSTYVEHNFKTTGTFKVCVTLYNSDKTIKCGPSCVNITVFDSPKADFIIDNKNNFCWYDSIPYFNDRSKQGNNHTPIVQHLWVINHQDTLFTKDICLKSGFSGNLSVFKSVTDSNGCLDSVTKLFKLPYFHGLSLDFQLASTDKCKPSPSYLLNTTDTNNKNIIKWFWDFDDGKGWQDFLNNDTVYFNHYLPGTYNFKLKAISSPGCEDSVVRPIFIRFGKFHADFDIASSPEPCAPRPVKFLNKSTYTSFDKEFMATWFIFNESNQILDVIKAHDPIYTFNKNGLYSAMMVIRSDSGCTDTVFKKNIVEIIGPKAKFWLYKNNSLVFCDTIKAGERITVLDSSEKVSTWQFYKGDGTYFSDTVRPADHRWLIQYKKPGIYKIYLQAQLKLFIPFPYPGYWGNCTETYGNKKVHPDDPEFIVVVLDTNTGLNDADFSDKIVIYPNPATEYIEVQSSIEENSVSEAFISDIFGKKIVTLPVKLFNQKTFTLNISDLSSGIYFLNVLSKYNLIKYKFMIIK